MSEDKSKNKQDPQPEKEKMMDPFAQVFQFYDSFQKSWSGVISETVSSKSFAESLGQQLESSLDSMTLFRRQFGDIMEQYLQQMSLPTRKEIISIAKRLTQLEMAMDDLNAKVDEVLDIVRSGK